MRVVAVHASDTALAVVCAPNHLLMFAAGSQRLLLEHVLPCTSQTCSVVHLDADTSSRGVERVKFGRRR